MQDQDVTPDWIFYAWGYATNSMWNVIGNEFNFISILRWLNVPIQKVKNTEQRHINDVNMKEESIVYPFSSIAIVDDTLDVIEDMIDSPSPITDANAHANKRSYFAFVQFN